MADCRLRHRGRAVFLETSCSMAMRWTLKRRSVMRVTALNSTPVSFTRPTRLRNSNLIHRSFPDGIYSCK